MKTLVTGAAGFVGANVTRALLAAGRDVRVLARAASDRRNLDGLPVEVVTGDLLDRESVRRACSGCQRVFHVAAVFATWTADPEALRAANVQGTRHVLQEALAAGVERVVHTSTVGAIGSAGSGEWADETSPWDFGEADDPYVNSKHSAELVALGMARTGLDVVVVNPAAPIGPYDVRPTPTGKLLVDYLHQRIPAFVDTTLNVVDVEDVARGHLLAEERGRSGERYILGGENLTVLEFFRLLEEVSGVSRPTLELPKWALLLAAWPLHLWADHVAHAPPLITVPFAKMAYQRMAYSSRKAENELGYHAGPVREAVRKAYEYFVRIGYAPARR